MTDKLEQVRHELIDHMRRTQVATVGHSLGNTNDEFVQLLCDLIQVHIQEAGKK